MICDFLGVVFYRLIEFYISTLGFYSCMFLLMRQMTELLNSLNVRVNYLQFYVSEILVIIDECEHHGVNYG